ncbi:HAMP domain-containing sensor histidine kinase [Nocardioides fonticola]|uniref:histidine kinase n=1 Tax=Nocardioides fonticola TaxID=450363 RepID=A0ABP7X8Z8_9ACTN
MVRRPELRPRSFRGQIVVSTLLLMTAVVIAVGVGTQVVLARTAQSDIDSVLRDRMDAVVSVVDTRGGSRPDARLGAYLDPGVRVYDQRARLVTGSIEADARDPADDLAEDLTAPSATATSLVDDAPGGLRLLARVVTTDAGWRGVVVVSQATAPYERSERYALLATLVGGLVAIAVSGLIAHRVTSQALRPVTTMAALATDWSEHDLGRRFDLPPGTDELAGLGASLDGLLDRVAGALRAEQRLSSELAHELRTPLTAIQGIAELGEMRGSPDPRAAEDYTRIAEAARSMSTTISTLLDLARHRLPTDQLAATELAEVVAALRPLVPASLAFDVEASAGGIEVTAPAALVVRCLTPIVENAVRHARTRIALTARTEAHEVVVRVADDGAGIDPTVADRIFDAGVSGSGGTGLGLAVALRVAHTLGGSLRLGTPAPGEGAVVEVSLPRG